MVWWYHHAVLWYGTNMLRYVMVWHQYAVLWYGVVVVPYHTYSMVATRMVPYHHHHNHTYSETFIPFHPFRLRYFYKEPYHDRILAVPY